VAAWARHRAIAARAAEAGATIRCGVTAERILLDGGTAAGIVTGRGDEVRARAVLVATDPFRLPALWATPARPRCGPGSTGTSRARSGRR